MTRTMLGLLLMGLVLDCGFSLANDTGAAIPSASDWGWVCTYGPVPSKFDAGCPPGPCGDGTLPSLVDGGDLPDSGAVCQCDTGAIVSFPSCSAGPCTDGTVPVESDGGACLCDDGVALPNTECQSTGPCADGTDPSLATGQGQDSDGNILILDGGTCACDDGTSVPASDCAPAGGG